MAGDLADEVVFVTGAGSGFGAAIARKYAGRGTRRRRGPSRVAA